MRDLPIRRASFLSFPTSLVMACLPSEAATPAGPCQAWQASKIARITLLAIYHMPPAYKTLSWTPPSLLFSFALKLSPPLCNPPFLSPIAIVDASRSSAVLPRVRRWPQFFDLVLSCSDFTHPHPMSLFSSPPSST